MWEARGGRGKGERKRREGKRERVGGRDRLVALKLSNRLSNSFSSYLLNIKLKTRPNQTLHFLYFLEAEI